jgi:lipoyl-dependent peroxiredoxin
LIHVTYKKDPLSALLRPEYIIPSSLLTRLLDSDPDCIFGLHSKKTYMKRKATAVWKGSGKEGNGVLTTQSTVLNKTQYSFNSRFADGIGTNPEELVAAAHAGCFAMKLSFVLQEAGFTADELNVDCSITLEDGTITQAQLVLKAKVPGISKEKFQASAEDAKKNCPISKLLNTNITLEANLV